MILDFELLRDNRSVLLLVSTSDYKFKIYDLEDGKLKICHILESRSSLMQISVCLWPSRSDWRIHELWNRTM